MSSARHSAGVATKWRHRKLLGIPVPVIAIISVLAVSGAAFAAIIFFGRVSVNGQVRTTPDIRFLGEPVASGGSQGNLPCVIPAPGTDGGGDLVATIDAPGRLTLGIDAFPGAVFDLYVWAGIPDAAGVPANLRIDGIDLGAPSQLDAVFVDSLSTSTDATSCETSFGASGSAASFNLLRSTTAGMNFLSGGSASKKITPTGSPYAFFAFALHIRITVKVDAPAGPITATPLGLRVIPATP